MCRGSLERLGFGRPRVYGLEFRNDSFLEPVPYSFDALGCERGPHFFDLDYRSIPDWSRPKHRHKSIIRSKLRFTTS